MKRVKELLRISNRHIIRRPPYVTMYVDKLNGVGYKIYGSGSSLGLYKVGRLFNKIEY